MWIAEQHRSGVPLEEGWIGRKGSQDFAGLVDYTDVYEDGSRRFDMGERSNFIGVAMSNAAMEQINEWGVGNVSDALRVKTDALAEGALDAGWITGPAEQRAAHMIGLRQPDGLPVGITDTFKASGISVSVRGDSVRVSPHLHTTDRDIERFLKVLRASR